MKPRYCPTTTPKTMPATMTGGKTMVWARGSDTR
jgi:hypothetical protein